MHPVSRLHMLHRFLRYRYRTERSSLGYVMREVPRGGTVLDVGANRGIYSYWLSRRVGPAGHVIGFEPQPDTAEGTRRTMQAFGRRNVRIESLAVGEMAGTATLRRRCEGDGSARLDGEGAGPAVDPATSQAVTVTVVALDDWCDEHAVGPIDFIKIDVEGLELPVLRGAAGRLARDRPRILFECWHAAAVEGSLFAFLEDAGYDGFFMAGNRRIPHTAFADHPYRKPGEQHRNYIFEPRSPRSPRPAGAA